MAKPLYVYKGGLGIGTPYIVFPDDKAFVNLTIHQLLTNDGSRFKDPINLLHKQLSDFDKDAVSSIDIDMDCLEYLDFFKMTDPNDVPSFDGLYDTIIILGPTGEEKIVYHCGKCIHPVDKSIYDKLMEIFLILN